MDMYLKLSLHTSTGKFWDGSGKFDKIYVSLIPSPFGLNALGGLNWYGNIIWLFEKLIS